MKEEVRKWLEKAESDLSGAEINFREGLYDVSVFLSQQAAEKALKAVQIQKLGKFYKVHDLLTLADSVDAPDEITNCCIKITPYYTITRYPDVGEPITQQSAIDLLDQSSKVVKWAKQTLQQ